MKYIIVDDGLNDVPYIFPEHVEHTLMASWVHGKVVSAGFISIADNKFQCYGRSAGLGIIARIEDNDIVNRCIGAKDDE